ncbi:MAG: hypothetical protein DRQ55_05685 [Planctomycetota bacterium]|nr:MAG: hypothetical protein DRQ55_05685 [Planctomycetota bacterium]
MKILLTITAVLALGLGSCSGETADDTSESQASHTLGAMGMTVVHLHDTIARCGCAIEEVGECGNYVQIDGSFVELTNSKKLGLGEMAWCGQDGVRVQTAGELSDGGYVAAELTPID